ncbi:hypothetical protein [Flavobacterium sp. FlaQc-47]|uniref:hypothetical protein n=1 Tax=Flavobacterium sp. FlaQc-47 TaxID=3374180 RepID=UPI0037574B02
MKNLAKDGMMFKTKNQEEIIVGYTLNGKAFSVYEYKENIQNRIDDVKEGTAKTYTSEQVLSSILKK